MSDTFEVTPAQVLAAQLAIEMAIEDGEEPDPALLAISSAEVVFEPSARAAAGQEPARDHG